MMGFCPFAGGGGRCVCVGLGYKLLFLTEVASCFLDFNPLRLVRAFGLKRSDPVGV